MTEAFRRRALLAAAGLLLVALVAVPAALAASLAYPARAKVFGTKTSDWTAQWFQWAYGQADATHPFYDESGALASSGQRGKVWFLCGAFNASGTVVRTAKVPAGRALLLPLFVAQYDNVGAVPPLTSAEMRLQADAVVDSVAPSTLFCTVDGVALADIARRRVASSVFEYVPPPDSLPVFGWGAVPGEVVYPAVADGYWVMLRPLAKGTHTIRFGIDDPQGPVDVTYHVDVVELLEP